MVDKGSAKLRLEEVEQLERDLDQAPELQDNEFSKRRAIRRLAPKIQALREKGYSWARVVKWLEEHGLTMRQALLQAYMRGLSRAGSEQSAQGGGRSAVRSSGGRSGRRNGPPPAGASVRAAGETDVHQGWDGKRSAGAKGPPKPVTVAGPVGRAAAPERPIEADADGLPLRAPTEGRAQGASPVDYGFVVRPDDERI